MERSFAHLYETGAMRRLHLRGRENILKRLLVHAAGFNLSLVMRKPFGSGKPRQWTRHLDQLQAFLSAGNALFARFRLAWLQSLCLDCGSFTMEQSGAIELS